MACEPMDSLRSVARIIVGRPCQKQSLSLKHIQASEPLLAFIRVQKPSIVPPLRLSLQQLPFVINWNVNITRITLSFDCLLLLRILQKIDNFPDFYPVGITNHIIVPSSTS